MIPRSLALIGIAGLGSAALGARQARPLLTEQPSGVTAVLQAVSAPSERVAWVTGHAGVVLRTTDGGAHWARLTVPHADSLQFRDIHAVDEQRAWVLAAGPGERSRIYHTADGGRTWALQFLNQDSSAFYDCFAFWDAQRAIGISDAVEGRLVVLATSDGGRRWYWIQDEHLPPARPGEGAFAASGTCVIVAGRRHAWIGTGATDTARVLRTTDGGASWRSADVPIPGGPAAGITTLAFRDTLRGVALGGDIGAPGDSLSINVAVTDDGGATWRTAGRTGFAGAVYGAAFVPGGVGLVAVGPRGLDWSPDGGATWATLDGNSYWSVGFASARVGWAVGAAGRITRIDLR